MALFARRPRDAATRPRRRRPRPAPAVSHIELEFNDLPSELDGVRIAHLSDIHVQRFTRPRHLDRAVSLVNEIRPDLTVLTGDYVCFHRGAIPRLALSLAALALPSQPIATLGNHDHWCDGPGIRHALERVGVRVLQNEHTVVRVREKELCVVGVDDGRTRRHDPHRAFHGVPNLPTVALTHDPSVVDTIVPFGPSLILAGHTHGGQIRLGKWIDRVAAKLGHPYLEGIFRLDQRCTLFVNRGLGASLPLRVGAPPEVALIVLRSKQKK